MNLFRWQKMALRRVLMCKPSHFEVEYAINPWMAHMKPVNRELAFDQWGALKSALECSGVYVSVIDPVAGLPDMVFTCDSGIAFDKKVSQERIFANHGFYLQLRNRF